LAGWVGRRRRRVVRGSSRVHNRPRRTLANEAWPLMSHGGAQPAKQGRRERGRGRLCAIAVHNRPRTRTSGEACPFVHRGACRKWPTATASSERGHFHAPGGANPANRGPARRDWPLSAQLAAAPRQPTALSLNAQFVPPRRGAGRPRSPSMRSSSRRAARQADRALPRCAVHPAAPPACSGQGRHVTRPKASAGRGD
jgi:hypothetical protein